MLIDLCRETGNFFVQASENGMFTIENGSISPVKNKYFASQYVAVIGGIFANGIYKIASVDGNALTLVAESGKVAPDESTLHNEVFTGAIYGLAIPPDFIALAKEVEAYINKNPQNGMTSYSFGISSASYATNSKGIKATWQDIFAQNLRAYWKMFKDIPL